MKLKLYRLAAVAMIIHSASGVVLAQQNEAAINKPDITGHWDRATEIPSYSNVPGASTMGGGGRATGATQGTATLDQGIAEPSQPEEPHFTVEGKALFDAAMPGYGPRRQMQRNDPLGRCEPMGLPRHLNTEIVAPHATFEFVQAPGRLLQIFEYRHDWREIWMDGRELPALEDTYPKWNGYSVGRWEGDTLVVESIGFDDRTWLDKFGYPHSEEMRLEERYRRIGVNALELTMTVTDPVVYAEPFQSDRKIFTLNRQKSRGWDEQIYCIPADEFSYQDLMGTGNIVN